MAVQQQPAVPATADVVGALDEALRAAVRRDGLDPQHEVGAVRALARSLVRAHDDRSLTGAVTPVADPEGLVADLVARVAGFGPLQPYLDDPTVEELWINSPDRVFIARNGRHELTNLILTEAQVTELVERMLKTTGRRIDLSRPFVDAMLPQGHRLHVVLKGISRGFSAVNIRKFVVRASRLSELVELGSLTPQAAQFLEASVRAGLNILVTGGTQVYRKTLISGSLGVCVFETSSSMPASPCPLMSRCRSTASWKQAGSTPTLVGGASLASSSMTGCRPRRTVRTSGLAGVRCSTASTSTRLL